MEKIIETIKNKFKLETKYTYETKLLQINGDNRQQIQKMYINICSVKDEIILIKNELIEKKHKVNKANENIKKLKLQKKYLNCFSIIGFEILINQIIEKIELEIQKIIELEDNIKLKSSTGKGKNKKQLVSTINQYIKLQNFYNIIKYYQNFIFKLIKEHGDNITTIKINHRKENEMYDLLEIEKIQQTNYQLPNKIDIKLIKKEIVEYIRGESSLLFISLLVLLTQKLNDNLYYQLNLTLKEYYSEDAYYDDDDDEYYEEDYI